jgi:hypothetical protein
MVTAQCHQRDNEPSESNISTFVQRSMYDTGWIFLYHTHLIMDQHGFSNAYNFYSVLLLRIQEAPASNLEQQIGYFIRG